jgi:hypothetical protein
VEIYRFYNEEVTRKGFSRVFDEIKPRVSPRDTFVFFYAGHGSVDGKGDFFFAPYDTSGIDNSSDDNIVKQDIVANILKIKARNTLIMLDTCRSGAILEMETAFGRLLEKLEQKAILAAALGNQSALELGQLQHGLFTWSVLGGCSGNAASADSRFIGVKEIIDYVRRDVPRQIQRLGLENLPDRGLSVGIDKGVMQEPLAMPPAENFAIIDRFLDPGELRIRSLSDGTVLIVGSSEGPSPIRAGGTLIKKLKEGTYTVSLACQDNHMETRDVEIHNNSVTALDFEYQPPPAPAPAEAPPGTPHITLDSSEMRGQFNGNWISDAGIRIQIGGDKIIQYFMDEEGSWFPAQPERDYFLYNRNNLVYVWMNKGGVWSETQTFSLSAVNRNELNLVWLRHVNNNRDNGDNEIWNVNDNITLLRSDNTGAPMGDSRPQNANQPADLRFNGSWVGEIGVQDEDGGETGKIKLKMEIASNKVTQYFQDRDNNWYPVTPEKDRYDYNRNNIVYSWVNRGGVWSETQVYSLSILNSETLNLVWSRHVNNYHDDSDHETWHLLGEGQLYKE